MRNKKDANDHKITDAFVISYRFNVFNISPYLYRVNNFLSIFFEYSSCHVHYIELFYNNISENGFTSTYADRREMSVLNETSKLQKMK